MAECTGRSPVAPARAGESPSRVAILAAPAEHNRGHACSVSGRRLVAGQWERSDRRHSPYPRDGRPRVGCPSRAAHRLAPRPGPPGARIGAECVVGRDAFIDEGVVLGDRVKIQNLALVYHGVTVEDGVFIGPNVILTNDRYPARNHRQGEVARADDWVVSPIRLRTAARRGRGRRRRRQRRRPVRDRGRGRRRHARRAGHALVAGNPARRLGWVCACGQRLADAAESPSGRPPPGRPRAQAAGPLRARRRQLYPRPQRGPPVIPISKPDIGPAEEQAVLDVLRSGMLAMGRTDDRVRGGVGRLLRVATPCS